MFIYKMHHYVIYLVHMLVVAPLLSYFGYMGKKTPDVLFTLLLALGAGVFVYHAYLYYQTEMAHSHHAVPVESENSGN